MLVNVHCSRAFEFILIQFYFSFNTKSEGLGFFLLQSTIQEFRFTYLTNPKHELDPPQISNITFPALACSLWCSFWFASVSRSAFQTLLFGFRVPFLGWILGYSLTSIVYLSLFTRACMYGCVFFFWPSYAHLGGFSLTFRHIQFKNATKISTCKSYISIGR